jgi:hypothetical protein
MVNLVPRPVFFGVGLLSWLGGLLRINDDWRWVGWIRRPGGIVILSSYGEISQTTVFALKNPSTK